MADQDVLPRALGKVHPTRRTPWVSILFTTLISFALITYVVRASASEEGASAIAVLGGTTALLLLCVFTVVNISVIVIRRRRGGDDHPHFTAPTFLPYLGALTCAFLAGPWARSEEQQEQYRIAGVLLHRAVAAHLADQPRRAREEDGLPRHRDARARLIPPPGHPPTTVGA